MANKKNKGHFEGKFHGVRLFMLAVVLIIAGCLQYISQNQPLPDGVMDIYFLDVGQGDSTFIVTEEGCVLIDTGESSEAQTVYFSINSYGSRLEYLIITHAHSDHMGGAAYILDKMDVGTVVLPRTAEWDDDYTRLLDAVSESGASVLYAEPDLRFTLGGAEFTFLAPIKEYAEINNTSAVIRLDYGRVSALFTGDAEAKSESDQLDRYGSFSAGLLNTDILHVGHHGSSTSSTAAYLAAVSPEIAVISCGRNNTYGHPTEAVLERLQAQGADILRTDRMETIHMTIDGETITVEGK